MLEKEELAWFSLIQFIIYGGALVQSKEVRSQKPAREKQNWNTLMKSKPNLFWIQILNLSKAQLIRSAKLSNVYFDIKLLKYAKLTKYTAMKKHKMQMCKAKLREGIKNRYFTVRLTVSVYVSRSRLLNPPPPLTVSLTVKYPFFWRLPFN